ncbi:hypothetical protein LCGC14_2629360 [marine sediment metagenome]|uniref:Uncharacterized protein n=1 Tax=marine sediment metagenome TaxID=412755 RepID=A0A0F9CBQ2_9ZZZZ
MGYLLADGTIIGSTSQAQDFGSNGIKTDLIVESTSGSGILIDGAADAVQLTVEGHSTQTSNILRVKQSGAVDLLTVSNMAVVHIAQDGSSTSAVLALGAKAGGDALLYWDGNNLIVDAGGGDLNLTGDMDVNGNMAVGTATVSSTVGINLNEITTGSATGAIIDAETSSTSVFGATLKGVRGKAAWKGTGKSVSTFGLDFVASYENTGEMVLIAGCNVGIQSLSGGTGTFTEASGVLVSATWTSNNAPVTVQGVHIKDLGDSGGTDLYGLRIAAQTDPGGVHRGISQEGTTEVNVLAGNTTIGADATPVATLHVDQTSTTGAKPVLYLDQASTEDPPEPFIFYEGTAVSASLDEPIVDVGDVTTATIAGYVRVQVLDKGNQITDQAYYHPLYTLA